MQVIKVIMCIFSLIYLFVMGQGGTAMLFVGLLFTPSRSLPILPYIMADFLCVFDMCTDMKKYTRLYLLTRPTYF